jgi:hypothetical protein
MESEAPDHALIGSAEIIRAALNCPMPKSIGKEELTPPTHSSFCDRMEAELGAEYLHHGDAGTLRNRNPYSLLDLSMQAHESLWSCGPDVIRSPS